ncbi:ATP-binding protein [Streptomyces sp. NPDC048680]|uniref:ATP-binding protein n=1 Tax=Streptomyces sp. NPDC048680 TaxID=3155492 RepID=UPI00341A2411
MEDRTHQRPRSSARGRAGTMSHVALVAPPFAAHRVSTNTLCLRNARKFTSDVVLRWDLDPVREDAVQIASELVANALRHGRRRTPLPDGSPPVVWLALTRRPQSLLCVVYDPSRRSPRLTPPAPLAEDHRGLPIVEALSQGWGWKPFGNAENAGKAVWARLAVPSDHVRSRRRS